MKVKKPRVLTNTIRSLQRLAAFSPVQQLQDQLSIVATIGQVIGSPGIRCCETTGTIIFRYMFPTSQFFMESNRVLMVLMTLRKDSCC